MLGMVQPVGAMELDHPNQQILDDKLCNELMQMQKYINRAEAQQLIDDGANVDRRMGKSSQYKTILHCCVCHFQEESCKLLLENGANPNLNIVDYEVRANCWEPIIGETPLVAAIRRSSSSIIKLLIEAGADVNTPEKDGTTPLVAACQEQTTEICKLLIDRKAVLQGIPEAWAILRNTKFRGPVWTTVVKTSTLLLKSGLDPLIKLNKHNETFLIIASKKGVGSLILMTIGQQEDRVFAKQSSSIL